MPEPSKAVERSCRLYRRLLVVYPRNHREEYGDAILQLFRDQCRDTWTEARVPGLIAFWFRALVDLLKTSFQEHLSNLNRTIHMLSTFRPRFTPLSAFLSAFAVVFLLAVIGSIVITFLSPETYVSTARFTVDSGAEPGAYFPQTEFQVIKSHFVLTKTIDALNLREIWGKKYNGGPPMEASVAEVMLRQSLYLQPVRNTKLIEIRAFSDDPQEAANLANGVVQSYRQYSQGHWLELSRQSAGSVMEPRPRSVGVTIIDPAVPDSRPIRPNKPLNITLGVSVGLLLGFISGGMSAGFIVWKRASPSPS